MTAKPFGLYVHIPFCNRVCHYCDFAKTANYSEDHVAAYVRALYAQLKSWRQILPAGQKFSSVFFGGGTPGVLTREYAAMMPDILSMTKPGAEITLESNPGNVTIDNMSIWRDLGFNRLSIGVQSFDPAGLKALTRDHSAGEASRALELAPKHFPKSNGDLIYGWPGQADASWRADLDRMIASGVNHLSLYALTFEGNTPFARAERRGVMKSTSGDDLASRYDLACDVLGKNGFDHEEISNWSRAGGGCDHNWLYWRGDYFVGIGAGAHGFVDNGTDIGLRYSYPEDLRQFLRATADIDVKASGRNLQDVITGTGGVIDVDRDREAWLYEYVGCGLRCRDGVDLAMLASKGFKFTPNQTIERAMREGLLCLVEGHLVAIEREWFRETAWSYEICASMS
jgi:oxygen-independent coproporphyrinogen-3 oxidase